MNGPPSLAALLALVALPFGAAAVTPLVYRVLGERTAYFAAAIAAACLALVLSLAGHHGTASVAWIPSMGVSLAFYVDGLAVLVGVLASGVGVLIFVYSGGYMHGEPGQAKYYASLLAFMGSMLGVAFAADLVALFVFWELTSLSSYLLIGHYTDERSSRYAARKSMLVTVGGGLFMLVGFLTLATVAGTFADPTFDLVWMLENAEAMRAALHETGLFLPVVLLVGVGAAAKSAQVPLHVWLPNAMEAPTPVSAFLHSATMVKAGVYLVGRVRPLLVGADWGAVFVALGLTTMTVTAVLAVMATDIKELLAYSTASHLGLIVAGFGFADWLGEEAALVGSQAGAFHILNHASFKAALFLVAGIVAHEAGTRRIDDLSGLRKDLPFTAAAAVVASLSMAGVPPLNGFYSKELLFEAAYAAGHHVGGWAWALPVVAVFGSVFTFLYSFRFLLLFFGDRPDALGDVHRPPLAMLAPPLLLGAVVVVIGLQPGIAIDLVVDDVYASVFPGDHHVHAALPTSLKPAVVMSIVTIAVGAALVPVRERLSGGLRDAAAALPPARADWWYDALVDGLTRVSARATPRVETGRLRTYAVWLFAATSALALGGYLAAGVALPTAPTTLLPAPLLLVLLVAAVAAVAVAAAPSHVAGVLTISILGFMVAIVYILASAPDLALTQLVVETLSLVLFLLVLDKLPSFYGGIPRWRAVRDGALSLVVGATVTVSVLAATRNEPDSIATYFVENAVPEGGGGNIVNVILVDFRGFDTMGEISVVAMAALSVLTLVAMRERGETR